MDDSQPSFITQDTSGEDTTSDDLSLEIFQAESQDPQSFQDGCSKDKTSSYNLKYPEELTGLNDGHLQSWDQWFEDYKSSLTPEGLRSFEHFKRKRDEESKALKDKFARELSELNKDLRMKKFKKFKSLPKIN